MTPHTHAHTHPPFLPCYTGDPVPDLPPVAVNLSDSEEEIDFGFWEKAPEPSSRGSAPVSTEATKHNHTDNPHEVDLNLL